MSQVEIKDLPRKSLYTASKYTLYQGKGGTLWQKKVKQLLNF